MNSIISMVLTGLQTAAMGMAVHYAVRVLRAKSGVRLGLAGYRESDGRQRTYAACITVGWMTLAGHAAAGALSWFPASWEAARLALAALAAILSLPFLVHLERTSYFKRDLEESRLVLTRLKAHLKQAAMVEAGDIEQLRQMEQQARSDAERYAAMQLQHLLVEMRARDVRLVASAIENLRHPHARPQGSQELVRTELERIAREAAKKTAATH